MGFRKCFHALLSMGLIAAMAGCGSSADKQASENKADIDRQKDIQKTVVENHADSIKDNIDATKEARLNEIELQEKNLDAQKDALADKKDAVNKIADLQKENVDKQLEYSKKTVDRNAAVAKDAQDQFVRETKSE